MVPHLVTALTGPLLDLEKKILAATPAIERWFRMEWQEHTPPFYCSVDLRNAGYKLAPVDTNLFPGGFHNLATEMLPLSVQAAMAAIDKYCPDARNLLMVPELHNTTPQYLQNVARLMQIFRQTGLHVRLGSWSPEITQPTPLALPDGNMLVIEPLVRLNNGRRLGLKDFDPCTILLNNDLSDGIPDILQNIHEQSLLPPLHAGWALRRKSNHYTAYDEVVKKFGKMIDVDPWMLNPFHAKCSDVNFQEGVPTFESIKDAVAEPVVYMIDRYVVGGFYRVHAEKGVDQNLNAPGSQYVPLAFAQQHAVPDLKAKPGTAAPNRFYVYGVVARLALLAASLEMERTDPNPEVY